jgi:hypothetical protein
MTWEKLKPIEGGFGGCLNCGYQHDILPMEAVIAVGFGSASLTKGDETVYDEQDVPQDTDFGDEAFMSVAKAEALAAADPDHDWRIHLVAPLSERHYQRQGDKHWVLYEKGQGFA